MELNITKRRTGGARQDATAVFIDPAMLASCDKA